MANANRENIEKSEGAGTFMTPDEVAALLEISPHDLKRMRRDGTGPAFFTIRTMIRYLAADVETWQAANPGASHGP
jgi:hypothetical protein